MQDEIDPNLNFPKWDVEMADLPFASRAARIGERAGGKTHEATTPPGQGDLDEEATDKAREDLERAGGGH